MDLERLPRFELEALVRLLLNHMSLETRLRFMSMLPITYVKIWPSTRETVLRHVEGAMNSVVS